MQRKIFKTGHSLAVTLSKNILDDLGLKEGENVEVTSASDKITITRSKHKEQLDLGLKIRPSLKTSTKY